MSSGDDDAQEIHLAKVDAVSYQINQALGEGGAQWSSRALLEHLAGAVGHALAVSVPNVSTEEEAVTLLETAAPGVIARNASVRESTLALLRSPSVKLRLEYLLLSATNRNLTEQRFDDCLATAASEAAEEEFAEDPEEKLARERRDLRAVSLLLADFKALFAAILKAVPALDAAGEFPVGTERDPHASLDELFIERLLAWSTDVASLALHDNGRGFKAVVTACDFATGTVQLHRPGGEGPFGLYLTPDGNGVLRLLPRLRAASPAGEALHAAALACGRKGLPLAAAAASTDASGPGTVALGAALTAPGVSDVALTTRPVQRTTPNGFVGPADGGREVHCRVGDERADATLVLHRRVLCGSDAVGAGDLAARWGIRLGFDRTLLDASAAVTAGGSGASPALQAVFAEGLPRPTIVRANGWEITSIQQIADIARGAETLALDLVFAPNDSLEKALQAPLSATTIESLARKAAEEVLVESKRGTSVKAAASVEPSKLEELALKAIADTDVFALLTERKKPQPKHEKLFAEPKLPRLSADELIDAAIDDCVPLITEPMPVDSKRNVVVESLTASAMTLVCSTPATPTGVVQWGMPLIISRSGKVPPEMKPAKLLAQSLNDAQRRRINDNAPWYVRSVNGTRITSAGALKAAFAKPSRKFKISFFRRW